MPLLYHGLSLQSRLLTLHMIHVDSRICRGSVLLLPGALSHWLPVSHAPQVSASISFRKSSLLLTHTKARPVVHLGKSRDLSPSSFHPQCLRHTSQVCTRNMLNDK